MAAPEESMIAYTTTYTYPEWNGRGQGSTGDDPVRLDKGCASSPLSLSSGDSALMTPDKGIAPDEV